MDGLQHDFLFRRKLQNECGNGTVSSVLSRWLMIVCINIIYFVSAATVSRAFEIEPVSAESSFAIIGDAGQWNKSSQSVRDSIKRSGVSQLILPGDNLYSGTYERAWQPWEDVGLLFSLVAIGNHNGGYAEEINYFNMPAENFSKVYDNRARFIILNSDNRNTAKKQLAWLRNEIASANEELLFIVYHHPSLTISPEHSWQEKAEFQRGIRAVFKDFRSKVTAIINGHDHYATLAHFDDLPVVVSGAVKSVRSPTIVNNIQEGVRVRTAWMFDKKPYWVRLDLGESVAPQEPSLYQSQVGKPNYDSEMARAKARATFHFVRAGDDNIGCTAHIETGHFATLEANCEQ